ncbi:N-acetylmuramoyl-L-alanine amidase family protein [Caminibacter mediatlanticus]|uniref:N-acetylmuramoyl-L-alanine amidase n=1 Tax=Caminibacter mediatlanticus TB-2 TaxID=391592 RepID=A0AAI9AJ59_9BACT|nr:N-acetylmuramoyl-L-alanine amidase [Caminibacter mediatlanticus]EDM24479.1 N-acetylmuramoyl-L-alanine amidase [Caminibacter mediatlanticus TB-2]
MKKLILLFFTIFLFGCNTKSYNTAYNDYYKNQQLYINALLNNDKKSQIKALKELIECGEYLNFDISTYKKKYQSLIKTSQKKVKKTSYFSKYIKIHSTNPLKITIPSNNIKHFVIKRKNIYKEVIDIKNAITPKFIKRKIENITLKIAQFNKNTVRIVYSSNKPFYFKYEIKNNKLYTYLYPKTTLTKKTNYKKTVFNRKKVIVIDPGHGGKDSGGIGIGNRYEKYAVLNIAKKLANILKRKGYIVYLTRKSDYFVPLKKRTHYANLKKANLFISLHCNIAPKHITSPRGIETYYLSPTRNERAIEVARLENKEIANLNYLDQRVVLNFLNKDRIISSQKFGIDVQNNIINTLRKKYKYIKNGGVRPAPFWVLVGTQMPAILIELGYLTNPLEVKRLFNPTYQYYLAKGIAKGVDSYFKKNP